MSSKVGCTVRNLPTAHGLVNPRAKGEKESYFTLAARQASPSKAFKTISRFRTFFDLQLWGRSGNSSRCPQIHGINRNRIALHVMLNGRRNLVRS